MHLKRSGKDIVEVRRILFSQLLNIRRQLKSSVFSHYYFAPAEFAVST